MKEHEKYYNSIKQQIYFAVIAIIAIGCATLIVKWTY